MVCYRKDILYFNNIDTKVNFINVLMNNIYSLRVFSFYRKTE